MRNETTVFKNEILVLLWHVWHEEHAWNIPKDWYFFSKDPNLRFYVWLTSRELIRIVWVDLLLALYCCILKLLIWHTQFIFRSVLVKWLGWQACLAKILLLELATSRLLTQLSLHINCCFVLDLNELLLLGFLLSLVYAFRINVMFKQWRLRAIDI